MTFSKCKTAFIKARLGRTESLIQLQLACHNILTALSSANLFSHRECYWRLRAPVNCRIPGDRPRGSANLNVSNLWCAQLLLRCLFLSKREHFKLARQNRWLQQIWASSWASHAISFKLPSLATVRIILSHPILYMQMSSCFPKQSQTLGRTFCCVYGRVVVASELSRCDLTREYVCLLCLYPHGWWLMHAVHSLGSQNMLYNHEALSLHIPLASAPLVENRPSSDSHKFSSPAPEASQADRRAKHNAAGSENMQLLWFRTWTSSTSGFMWAERRAEYVSFITYSCSFFCLTLPGF